MHIEDRARAFAALGDAHRLRVVDELLLGDRTFRELADAAALADQRCGPSHRRPRIGGPDRAASVGGRPSAPLSDAAPRPARRHRDRADDRSWVRALRVHPQLGPVPVRRCPVARPDWSSRRQRGERACRADRPPRCSCRRGLRARPVRRDAERLRRRHRTNRTSSCRSAIGRTKRCRRSRRRLLHWSVPDPVLVGTPEAFRAAFSVLADRVDRLAVASTGQA